MGTKDILNKLDKARTQGYHFLTIVVSGMGFFTDAFDLFCISMLTKLLGRIYYYDASTGEPGTLPSSVNAAVTGVALVGTLIGQIFFGYMGDKVGRQKVYGITLGLMIVCSIGSASAFGSATSVMTTLCFFRFWLGFGIGGDYPLSATIMSEYSSANSRGRFIAAVFAMQGVGILFAALLTLVVSWIFMVLYPAPTFAEDPVASTPPQADYVWRLIFALGSIPAIFTMYHRLNLPETARYTALVKKNVDQAATDMSKVMSTTGFNISDSADVNPLKTEVEPQKSEEFGLFSQQFWNKFGLMLVGTASCWFFLDVAFYSQNLFQKDLFSAIGFLPDAVDMSALQEVFLTARAQALVALCGTVPGYWVTVATIEKLGRFKIQLGGFFFMTLFTGILAGDYDSIKEQKWTFLALYTLTFFFANFGPNSTTFVVPAELFPARFRSTCHGISAASGKLGAILGAFGFVYLLRDPPLGIGVQNTLFVLVACGVCGFFLTFLVPETKGKTLEELSGELDSENSDEDKAQQGEMKSFLNSIHGATSSASLNGDLEAVEESNESNKPLIERHLV